MRKVQTPRLPIPLIPAARLPTCRLGLRILPDGRLHEIVFLPAEGDIRTDDPVAALFHAQVDAYLAAPNYRFDIPVHRHGTEFQRRVWQAIDAIPSGSTRCYGDIASALQSSPRAVGQACGANPLPLITPCHRVLARGGPGGFSHHRAGWLMDTKRWLLAHERS